MSTKAAIVTSMQALMLLIKSHNVPSFYTNVCICMSRKLHKVVLYYVRTSVGHDSKLDRVYQFSCSYRFHSSFKSLGR